MCVSQLQHWTVTLGAVIMQEIDWAQVKPGDVKRLLSPVGNQIKYEGQDFISPAL
jgi:hypothetical protein